VSDFIRNKGTTHVVSDYGGKFAGLLREPLKTVCLVLLEANKLLDSVFRGEIMNPILRTELIEQVKHLRQSLTIITSNCFVPLQKLTFESKIKLFNWWNLCSFRG